LGFESRSKRVLNDKCLTFDIMGGKPPKFDLAIKLLRKTGARGMFVSELARAADITPTSVNRYIKNQFGKHVKVEYRGGLKFIYWKGK